MAARLQSTPQNSDKSPADLGSACPVCRGEATDYLVAKDGYDFWRCADCGFIYLNPMPSQADLNRIYTDDDEITADFYPKAQSRRQRSYWRAFRFWRYVRGGARALDIGCGGGFMVEALRRRGADAAGLDVSGGAIAYAKRHFPKCRFYAASFDRALDLIGAPYDFIYASEIIEHVNDLPAFMNLVEGAAAPGAVVFVTTPDSATPNRPQNIEEWDVFSPPYHVQFFDQANLTRLFAAHGFTPIKRVRDSKAGLQMLFRKDN